MTSSTAAADRPPRSSASSSIAKTTSSFSLLPKIPAPLQRLFDSVPLVTYPSNHLPARSPAQDGELPVLYVFTTAEDAARGRPSFNPSCLKWQTYLKITQTPFRTAPSSNHASPTGSLPYLQPLSMPSSSPSPTTTTAASKAPIPSSRLPAYAASHTFSKPAPLSPAQRAHVSLLDTRIRPAWLHALYLSPANAALLRRLYAAPASSTYTVQAALLRQLRHAARGELRRAATLGGSTGNGEDDEEALYESARKAFAALEVTISEGEGGDGWTPDLFDASVFAYTHLLLDSRLGWGDRRLGLIVEEFPGLVRHRDRILRQFYGGEGKVVDDIGDSATWEKL